MNFLLPTKLKNAWALNDAVLLFALGGLAASFMVGVIGLSAMAQPPDEMNLDANTFPQLHKQIRPQPGESRWLELPWLIDLHAARQKAAVEGKPLFVLSGGGATRTALRRDARRRQKTISSRNRGPTCLDPC